MERGMKLLLSEQLVLDAFRTHFAGTFSEAAHMKSRWETETSLFSHGFICELSICHYSPVSSLISPPLSSTLRIVFSVFLSDSASTAASHMLLAESQLSLLSQSDEPGHTSGNPWQGSPLSSLLHHPPPTPPHPPYWADCIEVIRWLLRLLKKQNQ